MALVFFSWVDADGKASDLLLDASPSRSHNASAQVTEHPVETGAPVADSIRPMPRRLTIEGMITNTPIGAPPVSKVRAARGAGGAVLRASANDVGGGAGINAEVTSVEMWPATTNATYIRGPRPPVRVTALDFLEQFNRVQDSFLALVGAISQGCLFNISTSLVDYADMAAIGFEVTESAHGVDALQFTIEFQQLRIVSNKIVAVPVRQKKQDVGSKAASEAKPEEKSVLRDTVRAITNFFGVTQPGQ